MHRIETVRGAEKIGGCLGTASNARELGDAVRLDVEFPASLNDGRGNRVVTAACAQSGNRTFVVAAGIANLVGGQRGMVEPGFGNVGHASSLCRSSSAA